MAPPQSSVDLTNCDREPIHFLGTIQPIGFLIVVTTDWLVARASENVADFIGRTAEEMVGRALAEFLTARSLHDLRNAVALLKGPDAVEKLFACELVSGTAFDVGVHVSGPNFVIEAEPGLDALKDTSGTVRSMIMRLDQTPDLAAFYREGARQVRALLGYDRVMVYKFAADGSGEVVGEACKSGIGSFKGLHYPASDIPQQARVLYKRNLLRIIADVNARPVRIVPELDEGGRPIDLSLSMLRFVSPIHIEYLKNMGVAGSLSISIVVDGELWGLFACHHYSPARPSFQNRSVSELFAQMFAMRLESRERREVVEYERRARDISDQLLGAVASDETLLKDPDWLADILTNAIPADGVGVWINGSYAFSGTTPPTDFFRRIIRSLNGTAAGKVFATDQLSTLVKGDREHESTVAGLLAIPISRSPRDYVVLFRSEMVRSVRWAGDPHKPVEYGPNGPRLTPRESFAEWKELVQGKSTPFSLSELRVAETLRATLIEVVLRLADEAAAERHQASARQELLIAELNHRVRNILGVIRGLIRQSQPEEQAVRDFVKLVDGRIHALARAHNQITDDHWGPAPLQALIDAEAAAFAADRLTANGPPILLNPQAYSAMALVIHELVTNSTKYGSLSIAGHVDLSWHRDRDGNLVIRWRESGGPPVHAPTRKGFGTTIIERSVPYDLGGSAEARFKPAGYEAEFIIPARHVSEPKSFAGPRIRFARSAINHPVAPPPRFLAAKTALLVEDSLIISLDAEDILARLGIESVIVHATAQGALDYLAAETPSLAVLDINLGDRTSFPIADQLLAADVPFLFASGYGEQASLPVEHRSRPVIQKPYTLENIARGLACVLGYDPAEN